jgi:hypothetical protein
MRRGRFETGSGSVFQIVEAIEFEPVSLERFGKVDELLGSRWFDQVGVGTEGIAAFDVGRFVGRSENDDDEGFKLGLGTNPLEDFVAGFEGKLEIEKDDGGERKFFSVGVFALAGEIIDGFAAVFKDAERIGNAGDLNGAFHEENIVLVIVH